MKAKILTMAAMALLLAGTGFISQKLGNRVMPPMTFNAVRQLMAALVLTPIAMRGLRTSGYLSLKSSTFAAVVTTAISPRIMTDGLTSSDGALADGKAEPLSISRGRLA